MYLVLDVGGTFIKYALMNGDGEILEKSKIRTPCKEGHGVSDFVETIGSIYDIYKEKNVLSGIALSLPGQIDVENGMVYGGGCLRYMNGVCLKELLLERCPVNVAMENDGKCAALAEVWKGNAKDVDDACIMVVGTGIGGGIIHNRKVIHGKRMIAGELSFAVDEITRADLTNIETIEDLGVFEALEKMPFFFAAKASTGALCYRFSKKKGLALEDVSGEMIYDMAENGDEDAKEALEDMYFILARKCCNLYAALDPEIILIGGGISANPKFIEGIRRYVDKIKKVSIIYRKIKIDVCKFHNDSNLLGALYNYMQIYEC